MASTFVNPTMVARECLRQLKNNCVMGNLVFRGYEEEWKKNPNGWKIGSSVTVKAQYIFASKMENIGSPKTCGTGSRSNNITF